MINQLFDYDVILSLAGEQKEYAEKTAKYLKENGIKVWFYKDEEIKLWGKNQLDKFSELFTNLAKYCVVFISKEYTQKIWPNIERQFIQSRWVKDPEYLLPARFDDSSLTGIPDTISYISLNEISPEEFGEIIIKKIKSTYNSDIKSERLFRVPKVKKDFNPIDTRNEWIFSIIEALEERCCQIPSSTLIHDEIEGIMHLEIKYNGATVYSLNIHKKSHLVGDSGISFFGVEGEMGAISNTSTNAFGEFAWDKEKNTVVLKLIDMSLFDMFSGKKEYTKEEFIEALWNKICDVIENNY